MPNCSRPAALYARLWRRQSGGFLDPVTASGLDAAAE